MMSPRTRKAREALRGALPASEWQAVDAWLSTFYDYQIEWLLDFSRFAILLKARQIGASHVYAAACVLWAMLGETTTVISVGERESIEVLKKAESHALVLASLGSKWAAGGISGKYRAGVEVRLASGGRVVALPASSGGRSFSGNIILDEFAYLKDPVAVWDGASAVAMHGFRLRVLSTPNGVGNLFHRLWTDEKASEGFTKHAVTIDQARADGLRVFDEDLWKMARGDPRVYDQIYRCSFLDGAEQYIPTDTINACVMAPGAAIPSELTYYAGLDIGFTNDLSALYVIGQDVTNRCWQVALTTCKRTKWEDQQAIVAASFDRYKWKRLCVDSTGMGIVPTELLQTKYGKQRVEAVTFTMQSKEALATGLYQAFQDSMIRIERDVDLIHDVCSLKRIVTAAGNVRYDADRTDKGHADRAWALALALHACTQSPTGGPSSDYDPYGAEDH